MELTDVISQMSTLEHVSVPYSVHFPINSPCECTATPGSLLPKWMIFFSHIQRNTMPAPPGRPQFQYFFTKITRRIQLPFLNIHVHGHSFATDNLNDFRQVTALLWASVLSLHHERFRLDQRFSWSLWCVCLRRLLRRQEESQAHWIAGFVYQESI